MSIPRQTQILEAVTASTNGTAKRLKIRQRDDYLFTSAEYSANQTAAELIEAPGEGYQIVIKGIWLTTASNSGAATVNGTVSEASIIAAKLYATLIPADSIAGVSIPLDENTAVTLTSTTGATGLTVMINYVVDAV